MTPPTPEELLRLAREVAACAAAWEPAARLIGNVRADEVLMLANSVAALVAERDRLRAELEAEMRKPIVALKLRDMTVAEARLHGDPAVIRQAELDALRGKP